MTTALIDEQLPAGADLFDADSTPLPFPKEELVSLEEFKTHMEKLALERLGIKLTLQNPVR